MSTLVKSYEETHVSETDWKRSSIEPSFEKHRDIGKRLEWSITYTEIQIELG